MKIAVIGSRSISEIDINSYIPHDCDELVSGGARGVDSRVSEYAAINGIRMTVFLPKYEKYGRAAPIVRNKEIVEYSDEIIAFWDGRSKGTLSVINYCEEVNKPCKVIIVCK